MAQQLDDEKKLAAAKALAAIATVGSTFIYALNLLLKETVGRAARRLAEKAEQVADNFIGPKRD